MCVHMWCHAVFRMSNAKFPVEIQISMRQDVELPRDEMWHVAFTRDGIVTFTRDVVMLTKLNNRKNSSCL